MTVVRKLLIVLFVLGLIVAIWDLAESEGWQGLPDGLAVMGISALLLAVLLASDRKSR